MISRIRDHLRKTRKPTKKPLNNALNVTSYSAARTMFQAIETEYTIHILEKRVPLATKTPIRKVDDTKVTPSQSISYKKRKNARS